jgi:hypothetical protein
MGAVVIGRSAPHSGQSPQASSRTYFIQGVVEPMRKDQAKANCQHAFSMLENFE